jgi:hypothetical protein
MVMPKWFDRPRQDNNKRSQQQEKQWAAKTGGKVQPGSGSSYRAPQDVISEQYMDQLKFTGKDSFVIKIDEWDKLYMDALRHDKEPRLIISFDKHNLELVITSTN